MAAVTVAAAAVAPAAAVGKSEFAGSGLVAARGIPALSRRSSPLRVEASGKKIQTKEPYGPSGDAKFRGGVDAAGGKAKGKGVYQFGKKYGANVDGYSPIYAPDEWSPSGDVYAPGSTGLALWAVTLGAILLGGALLVYNTSALAQ